MPDESKENVPVTISKEGTKTEVASVNPISEMERTFDRLFSRSWPSLWRWRDMPMLDNLFEREGLRSPNLDVIDRDNEILVRAEIPGLEKEDLNISLTDNLLTIKGQSSREVKDEKGDYHRHEITRFTFSRSVMLPGAVDPAKTSASLRNGILEITLPKVESSKRRTITVQ